MPAIAMELIGIGDVAIPVLSPEIVEALDKVRGRMHYSSVTVARSVPEARRFADFGVFEQTIRMRRRIDG
jgi:hypothetical protein